MLPTGGKAEVLGADFVTQASKVRKGIGPVPQDLTSDEELTGRENIELQSRLYHIPYAESSKRADELLGLVGLTDSQDRIVKTYSGGMKKRLEFATGLVHNPKILFLDEPTLGLDIQTRTSIWDHIRKLRSESNMTIFLTTHYLEEADGLCDRIAIIDHGKIVALDTSDGLKKAVGGDVIEVEVARLAVALGGSISSCTGAGLKNKDELVLEFSDVALKMMWKIKSEFDPDNIMNPGKKLPTRRSVRPANGVAQD